MKKFSVNSGIENIIPDPLKIITVGDVSAFASQHKIYIGTKIKIDGKDFYMGEIRQSPDHEKHWIELKVTDVNQTINLHELNQVLDDNCLIALKKKIVDNFWEYPYDKLPVVGIELLGEFLNLRTM